MSKMETYRNWLQVKINHEYYTSGVIPLQLLPAEETKEFFSKSGILFRAYSNTQWNLLLSIGEMAEKQFALWAEENRIMTFNLIPSSDEFFYTSCLEEKKDKNYSIRKSMLPRIWRQLEIPFTDSLLNREFSVELNIQCNKKHLEFILIPKYNPLEIQLQLTEEKGKIPFGKIKKIKLLDKIDAYQFRSLEPVELDENNLYKIKLWEVRKMGNHLLYDTIPLPRYEEISTINPDNTITIYFYY